MTWSREFETPIEIDGKVFRSLRDAAAYITRLPKSEQAKPHWHLATDLLLKCAERGWAVLLAEIAVRKALNHGRPPEPKEPRQKAAKKYRLVS